MSNIIYSTSEQDEILTDEEFTNWSKRFLNKKNKSLKIARVILNSK